MSFRSWIRSILGLFPISTRNQRSRDERRRKNKRFRRPGASRPHLDFSIPQPAEQWSQSMEDLLVKPTEPTPLRTEPELSSPIKAPPRVYATPFKGTIEDSSVRPRRPRSLVGANPSTKKMDTEIVNEVITLIGKTFSHIPYAVAGLAAMVHHGFTRRLPVQISVMCPSHSYDVMRCWAIAQGMHMVPGMPSAFGVVTSDGKVRSVRVKFLEEGFEDLAAVRSANAPAKVLSLATLADHIARTYVGSLATASTAKQAVFARDMRWLLREMTKRGESLTYSTSRNIISRDFWLPFTLSFPDTVAMFADAGLAVEDDDVEIGSEVTAFYVDNAGGPIQLERRSNWTTLLNST